MYLNKDNATKYEEKLLNPQTWEFKILVFESYCVYDLNRMWIVVMYNDEV